MKKLIAPFLALVLFGPLVAAPAPVSERWHDPVTTTVYWMGYQRPAPAFSIDPNLNTSELNNRKSMPPRSNPYYVALPFDDLKHADLAKRWVPQAWQDEDVTTASGRWQSLHVGAKTIQVKWEPRSACLGRWWKLKMPRKSVLRPLDGCWACARR